MGFGHSCLQPENSSKDVYTTLISKVYEQVTSLLLQQPMPYPSGTYSSCVRPEILKRGLTSKVVQHLSTHRQRIPAATKYLLALNKRVYSLNSEETKEAVKLTILLVVEDFASKIKQLTQQQNLVANGNKKFTEGNEEITNSRQYWTSGNASRITSAISSTNDQKIKQSRANSLISSNISESKPLSATPSSLKNKLFKKNVNFVSTNPKKKQSGLASGDESHTSLVKGYERAMCKMFQALLGQTYSLRADETRSLLKAIQRFCEYEGFKLGKETQSQVLTLLLTILLQEDSSHTDDFQILVSVCRILGKLQTDFEVSFLQQVTTKILLYYERNQQRINANRELQEQMSQIFDYIECFLKESRYLRLYRVILDSVNSSGKADLLFRFSFSTLVLFVLFNILVKDCQVAEPSSALTDNSLGNIFSLNNYTKLTRDKQALFQLLVSYIAYGYESSHDDCFIIPLRQLARSIVLNASSTVVNVSGWTTQLLRGLLKTTKAPEENFVKEYLWALDDCIITAPPQRLYEVCYPIVSNLMTECNKAISLNLDDDFVILINSPVLTINSSLKLSVTDCQLATIDALLSMPRLWTYMDSDTVPLIQICQNIINFLQQHRFTEFEAETSYSICQSIIRIVNNISLKYPVLGFAAAEVFVSLYNDATLNPEFKFLYCHLIASILEFIKLRANVPSVYPGLNKSVRFQFSVVSPDTCNKLYSLIKSFPFEPISIVQEPWVLSDAQAVAVFRKALQFPQNRGQESLLCQDKLNNTINNNMYSAAQQRKSSRESQNSSFSYQSSFLSIIQAIRRN